MDGNSKSPFFLCYPRIRATTHEPHTSPCLNILSTTSQETPTLEAFEQAVSVLPNRHETTVRFVHISSPHRERVGRVRVDRRWHTMRVATLDRTTSEWNYRICAEPETKQSELVPRTARFHPVPGLPGHVVGAMVTVVCNMPQRIDAVSSTTYRGTGKRDNTTQRIDFLIDKCCIASRFACPTCLHTRLKHTYCADGQASTYMR
jgi:hypothetical protein